MTVVTHVGKSASKEEILSIEIVYSIKNERSEVAVARLLQSDPLVIYEIKISDAKL